jgi:hypothetical protein
MRNVSPDVEHAGEGDESGPGRHMNHVGDPQLIRAGGGEFALDQIRCRTLRGLGPDQLVLRSGIRRGSRSQVDPSLRRGAATPP